MIQETSALSDTMLDNQFQFTAVFSVFSYTDHTQTEEKSTPKMRNRIITEKIDI